MIYRAAEGAAAYPTIVSADDADGAPIAWARDLRRGRRRARRPGKLFAVTDSAYATSRILTVDATARAGADHRMRSP